MKKILMGCAASLLAATFAASAATPAHTSQAPSAKAHLVNTGYGWTRKTGDVSAQTAAPRLIDAGYGWTRKANNVSTRHTQSVKPRVIKTGYGWTR
jgi:hypothetical protein